MARTKKVVNCSDKVIKNGSRIPAVLVKQKSQLKTVEPLNANDIVETKCKKKSSTRHKIIKICYIHDKRVPRSSCRQCGLINGDRVMQTIVKLNSISWNDMARLNKRAQEYIAKFNK